MACINKALLKKIGDGSFDAIKSCQAFENLLTSNKKYIVESLNKIQHFKNTHGELTTRKLNKKLRRHITCLLVNNFLETYTPEIKQLTDEGEPEQPEEDEEEEDDDEDLCEYCDHNEDECECRCNNCDQKGDDCVCNLDLVDEVVALREELKEAYKKIEEPICFHCDKKKEECKCFLFLNKNGKKEIIIEKDEIITFSRCGRCENTLKNCICYTNLVIQLDSKIEAQKKEIFEMEDEQADYIKEERKRFREHINELKEEIKALEEINNSHKPIEKECNEEINKLKEEIKVLKHNKSENTRLKNKLEETERFRQENSKAVKDTVNETYKLNAVIEKLKKENADALKICQIMNSSHLDTLKEKNKEIEKIEKDNDFSMKNRDHFNNDEFCCLGCVCSSKIQFFTKLEAEFDKKRNEDAEL